MVTAELLYRAFGSVVEAHVAGVSFVHDTNRILDRSSGLAFPACGWQLPSGGLEAVASVYYDTYTVRLLFVDQTASDRSAEDMLQAHARMESIAKQCFVRFSDLYIQGSELYEGASMDLELIGSPTFAPVWDEAETMLTGVTMTFTVRANDPACVDAYFA